MTKKRGWWHAEAVELARNDWSVAQIAEHFGVSRQAVYLPLTRAGVLTEEMRRRRLADGEPLRIKGNKFEDELIERVERFRRELQRRQPRERVAWAKALRTLAEEALEARGL